MACHLLQAGVDLNPINAWLGHAQIDTKNIYVEIDFERMAKAMELATHRAWTNPAAEGEQGADGFPRKIVIAENHDTE